MAKRDYYEILGVDRNASQEEIKRAFRRLVREYHPDVRRDDPEANERFKEINEAYQVLSDPEKRARYDRYGHAGVEGAIRPDFEVDLGDFGFGPFEDLFEAFFGTRRTAERVEWEGPQRGDDLKVSVEISLEEVATGTEKTVEVRRLETCPSCFGTGTERGGGPETCSTCKGRGEVRHTRRTAFGYFTQITTCPRCRGTGTILRNPCRECGGTGRVYARREVSVRIPPGIEEGTRLRIPGEGSAGVQGGPRGDLYVYVTFAPHPLFERNGRDLLCEIPISMVQAALGDEIEIPGLEGPISLTIPPGVQPGQTLSLEGKGLPDRNGRRGDLYVRLRVEIPTDLSPEEQELLLKLAKLRGQRIKPPSKSLLEKVKELFS
ncbi:MAG: molecular chaperone DnaJ [Armatimonadota bacterium]|nr:molecular chaperone DnaJ [Armatimonadota bacterium]MDR5702144.1 molecular chaperone DnaJ [Armatimonadota bacterium]